MFCRETLGAGIYVDYSDACHHCCRQNTTLACMATAPPFALTALASPKGHVPPILQKRWPAKATWLCFWPGLQTLLISVKHQWGMQEQAWRRPHPTTHRTHQISCQCLVLDITPHCWKLPCPQWVRAVVSAAELQHWARGFNVGADDVINFNRTI